MSTVNTYSSSLDQSIDLFLFVRRCATRLYSSPSLPIIHTPLPFTLLGQSFKKGVEQDEARRRREETSISVRKTKKEDRLNKRRGGTLWMLLRHIVPFYPLCLYCYVLFLP